MFSNVALIEENSDGRTFKELILKPLLWCKNLLASAHSTCRKSAFVESNTLNNRHHAKIDPKSDQVQK